MTFIKNKITLLLLSSFLVSIQIFAMDHASQAELERATIQEKIPSGCYSAEELDLLKRIQMFLTLYPLSISIDPKSIYNLIQFSGVLSRSIADTNLEACLNNDSSRTILNLQGKLIEKASRIDKAGIFAQSLINSMRYILRINPTIDIEQLKESLKHHKLKFYEEGWSGGQGYMVEESLPFFSYDVLQESVGCPLK